MSKLVKFSFMIAAALLLFSSLTYAARPHPPHGPHSKHSPIAITIQHEDEHIIDEIEEELGGDEISISCEGVGEEECLMMRRTLVAQTDYIYTQKKRKP